LRRPLSTLVLVGLDLAWAWAGPERLLPAAAVVASALAAWRWRWPGSFTRVVGGPASSRWRGWWVFRRNRQPAMVRSGLSKQFEFTQYVPPLGVTEHGTACCCGSSDPTSSSPGRPARAGPPPYLSTDRLAELVDQAARATALRTSAHPDRPDGWPLAWGDQVDVRIVHRGLPDADVIDRHVDG
jgi:hypothetical protein